VALHLVDLRGSAMDTSSSGGRMMLTLLAGMAEFERALCSERTTQALTYKREVYGPTPYGYHRDGDRLRENATEMDTVRRIHSLARQGQSNAAIARRLAAEGTPTKRGGQWAAATVRRIVRNAALYEGELA
jgi:site-specific DNA recombinase